MRPPTDHWEGDARDNFIDNFASYIDAVAINQAALAEVLAASLVQHQKIRDSGHKDIMKIGTTTRSVLEELTPGVHFGGDTAGAIEVGLAIAGLALAIPTEGASVGALAIGGISVKELLKFSVETGKTGMTVAKNVKLGGQKLDEVMNNMFDAVIKVSQAVGTHEADIVGKLKHVESSIKGRKDMQMPKPADADGVNLSHEGLGGLNKDFHPSDD